MIPDGRIHVAEVQTQDWDAWLARWRKSHPKWALRSFNLAHYGIRHMPFCETCERFYGDGELADRWTKDYERALDTALKHTRAHNEPRVLDVPRKDIPEVSAPMHIQEYPDSLGEHHYMTRENMA